jgi:hypothetical protein
MTLQIDDRSGQLAPGKSADRGGYSIKEIILHETSGPHDVRNAAPDLARQLDAATITWFLKTDNSLSIHYLVGGENLNAPIYKLCPENRAAYHAVGNKGSVDGFSVDNHISIGIERMGHPWDNPGPNQTRAMCELALDICQRHNLKPEQIISHASIQSDRTDGNTLLVAVREYVKNGLVSSHVTETTPPKPTGPTLPPGFEWIDNPNNLDIYKNGIADLTSNMMILEPFASYFLNNGAVGKFGHAKSGLYGTMGSQEQLFDFAHFKLVNGKVEVEMVDRTNPQGFKVGAGIYGKCKELNLRLIVGEQWFSPDPGQPGLGKMSRAWAQDANGVTLVLMASELVELAKPGQDTPWKVEVLEVK